jgi:hypothetical protein
MREPLYRRLNIRCRKGFVEVVQSQLVIQIVMKAGAEVAGATRQGDAQQRIAVNHA